jgi:hypothetical protein
MKFDYASMYLHWRDSEIECDGERQHDNIKELLEDPFLVPLCFAFEPAKG